MERLEKKVGNISAEKAIGCKSYQRNEPKNYGFSPAYEIVEDYFDPNPLTTRTCTMSRICLGLAKKLSYIL